ncbi:gliding motility lipoprotein GldH [Tenacibaculum piscium]|uniref:gliding motility lipoprotein GldH n=1 Tax=Tenacibaculum piscium TaxID=1458515 RepID=UPI001F403FCD|nr:gliding motility lipoprotein GldH [Tenacibaculum piscium]MCG8183303.1 gliding motility lipoprotein GldH [Tenacibaculum piscium]MCG8204513.1 gliding motility lipoprotein GldH [Tenacibaculum piscium]
MKKNRVFMFFLMLIGIISCDSKAEYDTYLTLPNNHWNKKNAIEFNFEIKDTINKKNLFINLRNNNEYQYQNLFLITQLKFPDGQIIVDTLEYDMADVTGKFLGKGLATIKENKLFYKENIQFPKTGKYTFKIAQAMRKNNQIKGIENLKGISEVGFRIEKLQ